ncbi:MAG: Hint domain-containing protein, partial [Thermoplasmatales archaeon]
MSEFQNDIEELFWQPVESREELQEHIRTFLKIDLPDEKVDEESNSTPLDFVWNIYQVMLTNKGPHIFTIAAARNTAKTLVSSIVRFYAMIHFRRSGTHLAANLQQSNAASSYLDKFLLNSLAAPYIVTNNKREKHLKNLPANTFTKNDECKLLIAVATVAGVNSQRGSLNTRDELDLIDTAILSEAAYIADPTQDEHKFDPIEINLSSRKTATGPIQEKIDEAKSGKNKNLKLEMWSLADWIERCPSEIHKPEYGKFPAWINKENLKVTWDKAVIDHMTPAEKNIQHEVMGYEGCKTCPIFTICQGRAANQKSKSSMLRSISFVDNIIQTVRDPDKLIAQALNWKPESSSMVFRMFNREKHFLKYIEFYKFCFDTFYNPHNLPFDTVMKIYMEQKSEDLILITPTKADIYREFRRKGWMINYGIDWGYSPAQATCVVVAYNKKYRKAGVLHVAASQRHANPDWAKFIKTNIWPIYPGDLICPDMEDPASPSYFVGLPCLDTKPKRIETGVSQIRSLMWSPATQSSNFAILDDSDDGLGQNELLAKALEQWTHLKTALGFNYEKFEDDNNCDFCFIPGTLITTKTGAKPIEEVCIGDEVLTHKGRWRKVYFTMNRNYSGKIINLKPSGRQTLSMTPEHKILSSKLKKKCSIIDEHKQSDQLIITNTDTWVSAQNLNKTMTNTKEQDGVISVTIKSDIVDKEFDLSEIYPICKFDPSQVVVTQSQGEFKNINKKVRLDNNIA